MSCKLQHESKLLLQTLYLFTSNLTDSMYGLMQAIQIAEILVMVAVIITFYKVKETKDH